MVSFAECSSQTAHTLYAYSSTKVIGDRANNINEEIYDRNFDKVDLHLTWFRLNLKASSYPQLLNILHGRHAKHARILAAKLGGAFVTHSISGVGGVGIFV